MKVEIVEVGGQLRRQLQQADESLAVVAPRLGLPFLRSPAAWEPRPSQTWRRLSQRGPSPAWRRPSR